MEEYLKKKKMFELLKQLAPGLNIPIMKECEYKFYRGAEWLNVPIYDRLDFDYISMYHSRSYISIDFDVYETENNRFCNENRKTYCYENGNWRLTYDRAQYFA